MSTHTIIADAIVSQLLAADLSQPATISRSYLPEHELKDLDETVVTVVPTEAVITAAGRGTNQHDFMIDIAIQRRVDPSDLAQLDGLMTLAEEINDALRFKRPDQAAFAVWLRTESKVVFAQEHLDQNQVFTSVMTVTYRTLR